MVTAFMAFRGIDLVSTTCLLAELGDLTRFPTAPEVMGYVGLGCSEGSSGDRIKRGGQHQRLPDHRITLQRAPGQIDGSEHQLANASAWSAEAHHPTPVPARRDHQEQRTGASIADDAALLAYRPVLFDGGGGQRVA
jgi:hypothetical protein